MPWSEEEYTVAFLGATIESGSATKYSFAAGDAPSTDWNSLDAFDFLRKHKPANAFENTAPVIDLSTGEDSFMGYLAGDSVDYYKLKLGDTPMWAGYFVAYNANEGSGSMVNSVFPIGESRNLRANTFTRADYFFTGWTKRIKKGSRRKA